MTRASIFALGIALLALIAVAADNAPQTYKPDEDGFIRNWLLLDPIVLDEKASTHEEASIKAFFDKEYFKGQADARPRDGDKVTVDAKELTWHARLAGDYALDLLQITTDAGKQADNSLFLGVVYIIAEQEMPDVKLAIGSDDDSLWRLNGKEVIRVYGNRGVEKDLDTSKPLTLKKGLNVLSMAVINGDGPAGACARFLDKDGKPLTKLTISLAPPAEAASAK